MYNPWFWLVMMIMMWLLGRVGCEDNEEEGYVGDVSSGGRVEEIDRVYKS